MRNLLLTLTLILSVTLALPCAADQAGAGPFENSLWLGTDDTNTLPVLNTDLAGNELRRVDTTEATGIAIDLAANRIYFGVSGGQITGRDLNNPATTLVTINPVTTFGEDMAFDGTFLWRADLGAGQVKQIDPSNGNIHFSFDPGFTPLGLAWDGSSLWVSQYTGFTGNELIKQFTPAGVATGRQFIAPLGGKAAGGLAFDTSDNTLWIGTFGQVFHVTTTGIVLGSFNVPVPGSRFVDGLEFQGAPLGFTSIASTGTPVPGGTGVFTSFPQSPAASGSLTGFLGLGSTGTFGVYSWDGAIPGDPVRPIANLTTAIPRGTGTFSGFTAVAQGGTLTSFIGTGIGQAGVYIWDGAIPTDPIRPIVNLTTAIPRGTGTFSGFTAVAQGGTLTSFIGTGIGQAGVYSWDGAIPTDPVRPIANLTTAIPRGAGTFSDFTAVAQGGTLTSFIGTGTGQAGVYNWDRAIPVDPVRPIADLTTAIPGGTGTFIDFRSVSTSLGHTAFLGLGSNGQAGIYLASTLKKVIAVGDTLHGKTITTLRLGSNGLDGNRLGFAATFADGSEGVFITSIEQPFAVFDAKLEINVDQFALKATCALGTGSNGLGIPIEIVSLQLKGGTGAFSTTIPAASFKRGNGQFNFEGTINGVKLEASILPLRSGNFEFEAKGKGANLTGLANPVTVNLAIGDDGGSAIVTAKFK
jgi:hypothetical protein